jgi:hypothetical protein
MSFCLPSLVYLFFLVIIKIYEIVLIIDDKKTNLWGIYILTLILGIIWFFIINYVCDLQYKGVAWALTIIPVLTVIILLIIYSINHNTPNHPDKPDIHVKRFIYNGPYRVKDGIHWFPRHTNGLLQ